MVLEVYIIRIEDTGMRLGGAGRKRRRVYWKGTHLMLKTRTLAISKESLALIAVCTADTFLTMALLASGLAVEANPLMQRCFDISSVVFFLAKMIPLFLLVGVAEWYRKHNEVFVKRALTIAALSYAVLYFCAVFAVNFR